MSLISILLPARGRSEGFMRCLYSLICHAAEPKQLEVLVRVDDDDQTGYPETISAIARYEITRGPRLGYAKVYLHYNELARAARGDWMISWNDDVEMLTPRWDELVRQAPPHSVQFLRRDILETADTTFPCTGRSVFEAMGHLSLQTHADDWVGRVAEGAGVAVKRDDIVFHHYRLDDQTSRDRDKSGYDVAGFHASRMVALRDEDIKRVRAAAPRKP